MRRIVCAACLHPVKELFIVGPRHWGPSMHQQKKAFDIAYDVTFSGDWEQGFIDQNEIFMLRKEALLVAIAAEQEIDLERNGGGPNNGKLYSEGLY